MASDSSQRQVPSDHIPSSRSMTEAPVTVRNVTVPLASPASLDRHPLGTQLRSSTYEIAVHIVGT
jgi:hypothetical protein